jgi:hypothetical protein
MEKGLNWTIAAIYLKLNHMFFNIYSIVLNWNHIHIYLEYWSICTDYSLLINSTESFVSNDLLIISEYMKRYPCSNIRSRLHQPFSCIYPDGIYHVKSKCFYTNTPMHLLSCIVLFLFHSLRLYFAALFYFALLSPSTRISNSSSDKINSIQSAKF